MPMLLELKEMTLSKALANVLSMQRNELPSGDKKFVVTMVPHTRKMKNPIELVIHAPTAQQAMHDAMRMVGYKDQAEYKLLEMMVESAPGVYRIAYFNSTRSYSTDFNVSLPIRNRPITITEEQLDNINGDINIGVPTVKATSVSTPVVKHDTPEEDDYKESNWYEVGTE